MQRQGQREMPVLAMLLPKPPPHKTQRAEMIVLKGRKFILFCGVCAVCGVSTPGFFAAGDGRNKRYSWILRFSGCVYFMMKGNIFSFYVWSKLGYQVSVQSVNCAVSPAMEINDPL